MTSATISPPRASTGTGHHVGVDSNPSPLGRSVYIHFCSRLLSLRNQYATADIGTPSIAVSTSKPRYLRLLSTASGSRAVIACYVLPPTRRAMHRPQLSARRGPSHLSPQFVRPESIECRRLGHQRHHP